MRSWHFAFVALALALGTITAAQQRAEQRDMGLVGYNNLQARSAYLELTGAARESGEFFGNRVTRSGRLEPARDRNARPRRQRCACKERNARLS